MDKLSDVEKRLSTFDNLNERSIAQYLEKQGRIVIANRLQGIPVAGRQGDAFVDGVKTEFKTLYEEAVPNTIKNTVNKSISGRGQARIIVIDARNTSLTKEEAEQGVFKALGISRGKVDLIEVIGNDYFFGYTPKTK